VTATVLFALTLLGADPDPTGVVQQTFFDADTLFAAVLRGQNPGTSPYGYDPGLPTGPSGPTFVQPTDPYGYDQFGGGEMAVPGTHAFDPGLGYGAVGPQPYRFGWSSRYDIGFLPDEGVSGGGANGKFGVFEINTAWRKSMIWPEGMPQSIFSVTPEFNYRSWSGPSNPALPPSVFRFAGDFELASPANNPLSYQVGFTPALVTDFDSALNGDSFNYDVRGVLFVRASNELMLALGVAFWNRVDNILLPYAGVVWTPNDRWELRLLYPKSRISYFLGNYWGAAAWVYGGLEYNVEAYEIGLEAPNGRDEKIQLADYRALFGLRAESGGVTGFVEVGWVFDRQVKFLHGTPGFDINTGFIGRLGLRF